jgi:hypothetical protein
MEWLKNWIYHYDAARRNVRRWRKESWNQLRQNRNFTYLKITGWGWY